MLKEGELSAWFLLFLPFSAVGRQEPLAFPHWFWIYTIHNQTLNWATTSIGSPASPEAVRCNPWDCPRWLTGGIHRGHVVSSPSAGKVSLHIEHVFSIVAFSWSFIAPSFFRPFEKSGWSLLSKNGIASRNLVEKQAGCPTLPVWWVDWFLANVAEHAKSARVVGWRNFLNISYHKCRFQALLSVGGSDASACKISCHTWAGSGGA